MNSWSDESDQLSQTRPDVEEHVEGGLLQLAYRNNIANIAVNMVAGLGISILLYASSFDRQILFLWLTALLLLTLTRIALQFRVRSLHLNFILADKRTVNRWYSVYAMGLACAALLWGGLALLIRDTASAEIQFSLLIVISALAAGAAGILAPQLLIGRMYIILMLLQGSVSLLVSVHPKYVLGCLGLIFLIVMLVAHSNNHRLLRRSLELRFDNQQLVEDLEKQQKALEQLNSSLEDRVKKRTRQLRYLAEHDALTRLLNRMGILHWVEERERHLSADIRYAVLFLDLDRFKQINDGLGHSVGDYVLSETAATFQRLLPKQCGLCRWGGDEFIALIAAPASLAAQTGEQALETLRSALAEPLEVSGNKLHIAFSAGVAISACDSVSVSEAIRAADLASGDAKRHGRGTTRYFTHHLSQEQERRLFLAQTLKNALNNSEFSLVFQPIVAADLQKIESWETLLRWDNPILGRVSPDEFIPIAEDTGDIIPIGQWVLSTALSEFAGAGFAGSKSRLAINLSLRQLMVPDLPRIINRMLAKHHIPPRQLILEVTESIFERRERSVIHATLNELSNRGIQLHIDDFGAGYSSLSRLHEMPIRALKIDKSFVQSMDERARAIIEGSVLIARRFHIEVTAEGVETMDQCLALQAIGVDSMQGYLFGKPEPGFSDGQQLKDVCRQVYGSAENPESAVSSRGF